MFNGNVQTEITPTGLLIYIKGSEGWITLPLSKGKEIEYSPYFRPFLIISSKCELQKSTSSMINCWSLTKTFCKRSQKKTKDYD